MRSDTLFFKRWLSVLQILAAPDLGTAHAAVQLTSSITTLVADSKTATGLLRTQTSTDLDFDGLQYIDDLRFTESPAQDVPPDIYSL